MNIYFLKPFVKEPPTKTFEYDKESGNWKKISDYPDMKTFRGIIQPCDDLKDFFGMLKVIFQKSVFMIHGSFIDGINTDKMIRRSRSNHPDKKPPTIQNTQVGLFAIDIDDWEFTYPDEYGGTSLAELGKIEIEKFILNILPIQFANCDYVYQFSSSFGMTNNPQLKAHIFFAPKEPIGNVALRKWATNWNKIKGKKVIDPAIYRAVQPVYTTQRICLYADDPIPTDDFIGYVNKGLPQLDWQPSNAEEIKDGQIVSTPIGAADYDLASSIRSILTSDNFHEQIRSTALSLINKGISSKDAQIFLEEFMNVAKQGIVADSQRLADWQLRFDDIPRAIESAAEIVGLPDFDALLLWVQTEDAEVLRQQFAGKFLPFEGVQLKILIQNLDSVTGFGLRAIAEDIKIAKQKKLDELRDIARKIQSEERLSQGVHEIEITNSTYGATTTTICKILAQSKKSPEVYKIGNSLSVIEESTPKTIRQITRKNSLGADYPPMPVIHDICSPVGVIRNRVEQDCIFVNEMGKEMVCPDSILNAIPRMFGSDWKPLAGIVEHPFINNNWELVDKSGYDKKTGLYAVMHKKLKIHRMDPSVAYKYLAEEVLAEFPFQTPLDTTTTIGMMMSAIQRPYIIGDNGMPGYAIVSPKPSSGKTTLAQLLSYAIYNRPIAATGWSDSEEELGKHLLAILREGHSCVLFDNIKKDAAIKSNELAKAMTSGTYSKRKLGDNKTEEVPSSVLWLFTGNNIVFKGDFATRILPIRIVPKLEHPEFRKYKRADIGQWAMDQRKKIISAILSIVMAGKDIPENKYKDAARFTEWDKFVRRPLLEVCGLDLLSVFNRNDFLDDESIAKGDLLEVLHTIFGNQMFTTKDIMSVLEGRITDIKLDVPVDTNEIDLQYAIVESFNEKATINIRTLGRYILGMKDFILRGYMLIREAAVKPAKWQIVKVTDSE